jgi:hypothetical protein
MNTTTIIIAVAACLFALVTVVFTLQQVEKNKREKQSLIAALKTRVRNFQYLLDGFPEGFLGSDLKQLVCQCLLDALEQLVRLEPAQYRAELQSVQDRLQQLNQQPEQNSYQPLTNPVQIQEVQKLLNSLSNVVQRLAQSKRLPPEQANLYGRQIRRLTTRTALDGHLAAAQEALRNTKPRLAEHHYRLAVDKMHKDNADGFYAAQIVNCQQRITELERAGEQAPVVPTEADDAWKSFDQEGDSWQKKKSLYDE